MVDYLCELLGIDVQAVVLNPATLPALSGFSQTVKLPPAPGGPGWGMQNGAVLHLGFHLSHLSHLAVGRK